MLYYINRIIVHCCTTWLALCLSQELLADLALLIYCLQNCKLVSVWICVCVDCHTGQSFAVASKTFAPHVMLVHIYLFIAVFSMHLVDIFTFSHLCPQLFKCLYQRLNVSAICVLMWGLYVQYSNSAVKHISAMWQPYLFSDLCQM